MISDQIALRLVQLPLLITTQWIICTIIIIIIIIIIILYL